MNKICGNNFMIDASYCCGKFGFSNDDGHIYIVSESGNLIKKLKVGKEYSTAITVTSDGFLACGGTSIDGNKCGFFDFDGINLWNIDVGEVNNGPSHYQDYWYVADVDREELLIVKDGMVIKQKKFDVDVKDTAICGNYLAVVTPFQLYLYDLSNPEDPREIWSKEAFEEASQVAFSQYCGHIAVGDVETFKLKIYGIKGNSVLEKNFDAGVSSVAWWKRRIAVGLDNGKIYVYETFSPSLKFASFGI